MRSSKFIIGMTLIALMGCAKKNSVTEKMEEAIEAPKINFEKAALANVELGLGYLSQGQVSRSKEKLIHALKLGPKLAETHSAMGYFFEHTGEIVSAEKEYRRAIQLSRDIGGVYNNYGAFLCRQERYKQADEAFQKALTDNAYPHTAALYANAGSCAAQAGHITEAETYFLTAFRRDSQRVDMLLRLAELAIQRNEAELARNFLKQYRQHTKITPQLLKLEIQVAKLLNEEDAVASAELQLKGLF
jgi:type IV pilus assembly protein PilF